MLAKKDGNKIQVYGLMDGTDGMLPFLHLLDQAKINLLGAPVDSVEFRQQPIIDALDQTQRMIAAGTLYTLSTSDSTEALKVNVLDVERLALDQRLAIWRADAFAPTKGDPRLNFEIGTPILPTTVQPPAPSAQFGYFMSQATQNPTQAWRWLSFLSRQPVLEHTGLPNVPARTSVAEQLRLWQRLPAAEAAAIQAYMQQPLPAEQSLGNEAPYVALSGVWSDLTAGRVAPNNLVAAAQARLDEQRASAKQPAAPPLVVATPEIIPPNVTLITFGVSFPADGDVHAVAKRFMAQHPEIRVRLRRVDGATRPQALRRAAAQLDCFGWEKPLSSATMTATLDLKPFINAERFDLGDYPKAALAPFERGDALHGLPYALQLRVLDYNEALFKSRGVNGPTANWTLDQFLNAAQQLTQRKQGGGSYGYGQTYAAPEDIPFFLHQFEASITQQTPEGLQPNYLDAKVVAALRFYTNLLADYSANQKLSGFQQGEGIEDVLSRGQTGMWLTRSADGFATSLDRTNPLFEPRVTFPPLAHPERAPGDMGVSSLFISASSPHAAACWQWLKFFSEQGALVHPSQFPARISVAESQAYLSRTLPGAAEVYRAYAPLLRETSATAGEELWDDPQFDPFWLYQAIDRAIQGKPLASELAQAQDTTERYLLCVRSGSAPSECALRIDPDYKGIGPAQ